MALDERADAVTTVDADEADAEFAGLSVAPAPTNGQDREPAADAPEAHDADERDGGERDADGSEADGSAAGAETSPFGPPNPVATNGTGSVDRVRPGRKRTSKQRALLLAEAAAAEAADDELTDPEVEPSAHVDPLLAAAEAGTDTRATETDVEADAGVPAEDRNDQETAPAPAPFLLPAAATATAISAAVAFAPSPSVTEAVPLVAPSPSALVGSEADGRPAVVVVPPPPRPRRRARPRVRKVTRVVRSVDAWSVFKVALVFFTAMGVVLLTAGVLLWNLAQTTGTLDNVEGFFREAFQYDSFKLQSEPIFRAGLTLIALFIVIGTGLSVVMAVLFNLIADLTGGIRLTVLEREVVARDDVRSARAKRKSLRTTKRPPIQPATLPPDVPVPPPPG
jgi:Transmembrane domain of unknown function (DUF3566)